MKLHKSTQGFAAIEAVIVVLVLGVVGLAGWLVYNARQSASKGLDNANKASQGSVVRSSIKTFEDCKKASGSKILETYPEQCRTKDGKTFTDKLVLLEGYIVIKEWNVKVKMTDASKVHYTYVSANYGSQHGSEYDSYITVVANDGQIWDKTCSPDLQTLMRSANKPISVKVNDSMSVGTVTQVGKYYYWTPGSGMSCGTAEDKALMARVQMEVPKVETLN